jgi:hypothetical protein
MKLTIAGGTVSAKAKTAIEWPSPFEETRQIDGVV